MHLKSDLSFYAFAQGNEEDGAYVIFLNRTIIFYLNNFCCWQGIEGDGGGNLGNYCSRSWRSRLLDSLNIVSFLHFCHWDRTKSSLHYPFLS